MNSIKAEIDYECIMDGMEVVCRGKFEGRDVEERKRVKMISKETIPFTPRQLEAFIRIAEASARMRLSPIVTVEDADRAIGIVEYYMTKVGMEHELGTFNIDLINTGITKTQKDRMKIVSEIIKEVCNEIKDAAPIEEIISRAEGKGLEEDEIRKVIEKMRREGIIFEPRHGRYKLTSE